MTFIRLLRLFPITILALAACGPAGDRSDAGGGTGGAGNGGGGNGGGGGSGAGGAAGGPAPVDCTDLSRATAGLNRNDFRVTGSGFDAYEGQRARAVVAFSGTIGFATDGPYALGDTVVRNGAFEIALPKTISPYNVYGVYIDTGKDDACTLNADPSWQKAQGGVYEDVNWAITPETMHMSTGLPACNLDGVFDLTRPLHCPG